MIKRREMEGRLVTQEDGGREMVLYNLVDLVNGFLVVFL